VSNTVEICGYTPNMPGLEELYETCRDQGLVIVGVAANDFGGQEPARGELKTFCQNQVTESRSR